MFARLSLLALTALAPSCMVVHEDNRAPFDIDPPTELWELMVPGRIDDLGRDWIDRCLDSGGQPVLLTGVALCADRDY